MHDTDMAGLLYFARQFRFAHDALEDFMTHEGLHFHDLFRTKEYVFVIVHAEADYKTSMKVGDQLEIHVSIHHIGSSSFTIDYQIYRNPEKILVGTAQTVHVTIDPKTHKKIPIPAKLKHILQKHHGDKKS
jgi:1,4-dihydroxy-2-naphthoyl-CoA hydrolase